jgi:hypothetical protein
MAFGRKAKDPFQEIQSCLQKRDYKGALVWFNPLLKKDKKNTQIRLRYADTLVLAGSKKEAIRQYRVVADELAEAGFMIRAIAINKKIVQLDPSQSDVHEKLAAMNEQRSQTTSSTGVFDFEVTSATPEPPQIEEAPPPVDETPLPTLTLEESMEMEFGETAKAPSEEELPAALPAEEAEVDEVIELDVEEVDIAAQELVSEVELEPPEELEPAFEVTDEAPSFSEEPIALNEGEPEPEEEIEIPVEDELEPEPFPEEDDLDFDIETEPELAANGMSPLVGLLGDDIDLLVDSIIDDLASSRVGVRAPASPAATRIPLFSDLTAEEFVEVAIMLIRRAVKAETTIVREGDPGDSMFIVSTGEVEATREDAGRPVKLATFRDGDFFGEMAVLSGEPRTATVTTVSNTELLELKRDDLNTICSRHPEVEAKLKLASDERRMKTPS